MAEWKVNGKSDGKIRYSVIIPIYNKEQYLYDCIQSVINQKAFSLQMIELILINDGSKDTSLEICKRIKEALDICEDTTKLSEMIIIIDKTNSGVSDTRNLGIELAHGEYIIFMDADDFWSDDFMNTVDKLINNNKELDILFYGSCRDIKLLNTESEKQFNLTECDKNNLLKSVVYNQHKIENCKVNFNRVTDYVISTKLLQESNIRFNRTLKIGEDKLFNFELFQHIKNISFINKRIYYIRTNDKSVMGSYSSKAFENNSNLYKEFSEHIDKIDDTYLNKELQILKTCIGFQVVWNSITSDYCHKDNTKKISERRSEYSECKKYLKLEAAEQLNEYEKYLFKVFNYPFVFMDIVMKNRLIRGILFYCHKILKG